MATSSWSSTGTAWIFNPDTGEFRSITTHRSGYDMGNGHTFESEPVMTDEAVTDFSWEEATDPGFMAWIEDMRAEHRRRIAARKEVDLVR